MTHAQFTFFLFGTIVTCCAMSVVNALKNGRRGWKGMILSVAFLVFAFTVYCYYTQAAPLLTNSGFVVLFTLLVVDFFFRAGNPRSRHRR